MTHPVCAEPVRAGFFFQQPEIFPLFSDFMRKSACKCDKKRIFLRILICDASMTLRVVYWNHSKGTYPESKRSNYNGKISVQSISECNFI